MKFAVFALILALASNANAVCYCVDRSASSRCAGEWCSEVKLGWQCVDGNVQGFGDCCNNPGPGEKGGYRCN
ncbi:hypothetical protein MVEG_01337 [Podila verticillata NRRL 6337]|nr:hypothetical protein MVEG_01337 [Podila verticillata NRRL 6337]